MKAFEESKAVRAVEEHFYTRLRQLKRLKINGIYFKLIYPADLSSDELGCIFYHNQSIQIVKEFKGDNQKLTPSEILRVLLHEAIHGLGQDLFPSLRKHKDYEDIVDGIAKGVLNLLTENSALRNLIEQVCTLNKLYEATLEEPFQASNKGQSSNDS